MRWIWLPASLVVLIAVLAGCGGHDNARKQATQTGTGPSSAGSPQGPGRAGGRRGGLSAAEYRVIVREYTKLKPLQQRRDDPAALTAGRRACAELRSPNTLLVARVRADCNNAIVFFIALNQLERAGSDCTAGSQRDRIVCGRDRYSRMAAAIRTTTDGGLAINAELQRRGITGLCADSIGMTPAQVASYRRAQQAAKDAVDAIGVADALGFERAQNELADALDAGATGDPLAGIIRGCRPAAATPSTPRPAPRKPTPKSKPKPLPSVPDGGGIKA
jgi:hypothetical protein